MPNEVEKKSQDYLVEARRYKFLAAKEREKGRIRHAQEMEQFAHICLQKASTVKTEVKDEKVAGENPVPQTN